jgi:subtilisin family serine protease
VVPIKVLNDAGGGHYPWISEAIRYVADLPDSGRLSGRARIINLSLGGASGQPTPDHLRSAIDYAIERGCFVIAAAGNSGFGGSASTVGAPGNYGPVITVASVDRSGNRSSFSSGGRTVDLAAPGGSIYSTHKGGTYAKLSGTAMACPMVAAVAALVTSLRPDITHQDQLADYLCERATDVLSPGKDNETGYGIPVLDRLLPAAREEAQPLGPEWEALKTYGRRNATGMLTHIRYTGYGHQAPAD